MKLISFSGSGIVHKLDNLTNNPGFISVQNGNMWGPELQKQTWILSQTWSESGTLFKCLKAQPAAGFPETELGETRTVALHVSVHEGRHSSCWKNANTAINNTEGLKEIINAGVVAALTPLWVASHCSAVLYARLRRNVGPGQQRAQQGLGLTVQPLREGAGAQAGYSGTNVLDIISATKS